MATLPCSIMELTLLLILLALELLEVRLVIMNGSPVKEQAQELEEVLVALVAPVVLEVEVLLQEVEPQDILALSNRMQ
jgi:hypothetical protein